ncbi:hypothetical protein L603_002300000010, partial [Cellulosimicrobium cellulans J34]
MAGLAGGREERAAGWKTRALLLGAPR